MSSSRLNDPAAPLRIHVVSDLHVDIAGNAMASPPPIDADVTVVAGDAAAPGTIALHRVRDLYPDRSRPLIYIPGNHDFYSHYEKHQPELKTTWEDQKRRMPEIAGDLSITLLDDSTAEVGGVLFIGSTLWTDMSARPPYMTHAEAVRTAERGMNDYRLIKTGAGRSRDKLTAAATVAAHAVAVSFIKRALVDRPKHLTSVVVTHHAPSRRSLLCWTREDPNRINDLDWCYASDCEALMSGEAAPRLWVHGHIHANQDYQIGETRIVANPRGYPLRGGRRENPDFDPALVIEIDRKGAI
jgi:predicted phosphodiesterase